MIERAVQQRCEEESIMEIIDELRKEIELYMVETESKEGVHNRVDKLQTLQKLRRSLFFYEKRAIAVGDEAIRCAIKQMRDFITELLK